MNGSWYIGFNALSMETPETKPAISKVILLVDDENYYEAGTDTGTVIEATCPYATQAMANAVLSSLQGYAYQPVTAGNAKISPFAELGDGITVNGIYTQMASQTIKFSPGEVADVSAPSESEVDHEYQMNTPVSVDINRKIATVRSQITKTADEITLQINGINNEVSSISTKLDSITLSVSNGSTSSTISLSIDGETQEAQIEMDGLVTFTGLEDGTTVINGGCIQTGTIDAANVTVSGDVVAGGTIRGASLGAATNADQNYVEVNSAGLDVYVDGSVKARLYTTMVEGQDAPMLRLGNTDYAFVEKYFSSSGHHMMWVGNSTFSCGLRLDFTAGTYRLVGTQA